MTPREQAVHLYNSAGPLIATDQVTAFRMLGSAVDVDPTFAQGWVLLGAACADLGMLKASVSAYRAALGCADGPDPSDMNPVLRHRSMLQLGHRLINNNILTVETMREAEGVLIRAMALGRELLGDRAYASRVDEIRTSQAFCHTNLSLIASLRDEPRVEIAEAEEGFAMTPNPVTELGLAFAYLHNGAYRAGLDRFEARFPHERTQFLNLPWPRWDGRYVERLVVLADMGLGDSLSFARFLTEAASRVGTLTFQAQPELVGLLTRAFAGVPNIRVIPESHGFADYDAWAPIFSLPCHLNLTTDEIREAKAARLPVRPLDDLSWKRKGARKHIAIAWAGAPGNGIDVHRSIPVTEFLALRNIPGVALYSVQVGERQKQLHEAGCAPLIKDLSVWIRDCQDTAGILAEMDCVVVCESFVGHLAGAMGKKTALMCSHLGRDWRSSPRLGDRALWYPNHKVYRQGSDTKWGPAFARVVEDLTHG